MSILLQKKNVGDHSYMSSPNIYYRAYLSNVSVIGQNELVKSLKSLAITGLIDVQFY